MHNNPFLENTRNADICGLKPYSYMFYNCQFAENRFLFIIQAHSPEEAIKKSGLVWFRKEGGAIHKTRKGKGYTNTAILFYAPETVLANAMSKPDFLLERIL